MRNEHAEVIGVRMIGLPWTESRGAKFSRRGSQSGIFIPRERGEKSVASRRTPGGQHWPVQHPHTASSDASFETLYITEGASDTAAAISLGLRVIGRASCNASTAFVDRYIHRMRPLRLVVIADHDDAGRTGAKRLAKNLCEKLPRSLTRVSVIMPPTSGDDLRDWIAKGANQNDIINAEPNATYSAMEQLSFSF